MARIFRVSLVSNNVSNLYDSSRGCLGVPVFAFRNRQCKVCTAFWYSVSGIAGPNLASCSAVRTAHTHVHSYFNLYNTLDFKYFETMGPSERWHT